MNIIHCELEPGTLPVYADLMSTCVQIHVPHKGWIRQKRKTKDNKRSVVPLSLIQKREINRWVRERASRLSTKSGTLILFYRPDSDGYGNFGLAHDSRKSQGKYDNVEGLPTRVEL